MTETQKANLSSSQEDYLEAILALIQKEGVARVRDIAERLEVGKSAVTAALKLLSKRKLVNYDPYQLTTLTDRGARAARAVTKRHEIINRFLKNVLGLNKTSADTNACRIEHAIDETLLNKIDCLAEFIENHPKIKGENWLKTFKTFCSERKTNK